MTALRWSYSKIAEPSLHDHACAGDFIPFDWNAQPGFGRSPAPNSDQQIGPVVPKEQAVELSDRLGYFLAAAALEALRVDHDHIVKVLDAAVAQNFAAPADQAFGWNLVKG